MTHETFRTLYTALLFAAAITAAWVSFITWQRRHAPGAKALAALTAGECWWSLCFALMLIPAVPRPEPLFWSKLMFVGVVVVPAAFLIFALQYANHNKWVTSRTLALLTIEPVLTLIAYWTDPWHHLFTAGYVPGRDKVFTGGIAFWIHSAYSYTLITTAIVVLAVRSVRAPPVYRKQALIMLSSAGAVIAANLITIFRLVPMTFIDFTPVGFTIASAITAFALFRYKLLDLVPIAREAVVDRMQDAVLVLDAAKRVIDYNPAAAELLNLGNTAVLGEPVDRALAAWPEIAERCKPRRASIELLLRRDYVRYVDLRVTELRGGRLVVLRDISEMKRIESELRAANERLQQKLAEIERLQAQLKEQAIRDSLTGLYNRRFLEESLARELAKAKRTRTPLSIAVLDLDHFKNVNDRYGHIAGDQLLEAIGLLLGNDSREGDIACRYGGEEFVMIMPGASVEAAMQRTNEWRQAFATTHVRVDNVHVSTTVSAGVATFPQHGETSRALLDAADQALYAAKAAGRNRVVQAAEPTEQRRQTAE